MMKKILMVLLVSALFFNSVHAGVYTWVDEHGQVHFGDSPQKNVQPERVKIQASPTLDPETLKRLEKRERYIDARQKERSVARETREKSEERAAVDKENCKKVKARLSVLERGGRMYSLDKKGERHYLEDDERQAALLATQQDVNKYCK